MTVSTINILFLGDIVGRRARHAVITMLPALRDELSCHFVVANCENAAGGFGITPSICEELFACGIDVLTTGNHAFDKGEIAPYFSRQPRLLRPLNMESSFPGAGYVMIQHACGWRLGVANIIANLFMRDYDPAFKAASHLKETVRLGLDVDALLVDFHGEATSEKISMGYYFDGYASIVVGTHTHVPTSDTRILSGGTAYQTDVGMCGDYDSVIGMDKEAAISRFTDKPIRSLSVAKGEPSLCGIYAQIDAQTGLAISARPFQRGGVLGQASRL